MHYNKPVKNVSLDGTASGNRVLFSVAGPDAEWPGVNLRRIMMTAKKATVTTKKAAETAVTSDPVKTEAPVKAEKPAEKTTETKAPVKAEPVKKAAVKTEEPAAKAEPVKKAAAKKAEPVKKAAAKKTVKEEKTAVKQNVYVQFAGNEILTSDLVAKVTETWVAQGHRASSIKSLDLYVKPEDMAAYYVINGKDSGKIEL